MGDNGGIMPVRVGLAGYGYWGPYLVRNLVQLQPQVRVVRVCDLNKERLSLVRNLYPFIETTQRFDDLLGDDIDAVVIVTPVMTHESFAYKAIKARKHVLIEKPFVTSAAKASQLVNLARKQGTVLMVDHVFVYTPAVAKIKELCRQGNLGKIIYFDSVRTNLGLFQRDTNVIWDLAPHDVSIMLHCLEDMPLHVSATGLSYFKNGHASVAYAVMHFRKNMIAHFHWSWLSPVKVRTIFIGGDKKMVCYDDIQSSEKLKIFDKGIISREHHHQIRVGYRSGDMIAPRLDTTEALQFMCKDFMAAVALRKRPVSDGAFSLKVVRIVEALSHSLKTGGSKIRIRAAKESKR